MSIDVISIYHVYNTGLPVNNLFNIRPQTPSGTDNTNILYETDVNIGKLFCIRFDELPEDNEINNKYQWYLILYKKRYSLRFGMTNFSTNTTTFICPNGSILSANFAEGNLIVEDKQCRLERV